MRYPYVGIFLLIFSISAFTSQAQNETDGEPEEKMDKDVQKAYDAYEAMKYSEAIELLKEAYTEVRGREDKAEVLYMTAESYRNINDYENAERYYERAIKVGYKEPEAILKRGDMFKAQGEYEEAIEVYQKYKEKAPSETKADEAIEYARKALEWEDKPTRYQVDIMPDINSRAADFSVTFGGDRRENDVIVFTSNREESEGNGEDEWMGQSFSDLFTSQAERKTRRRRRGNDEEEVLSYADLKWSTPVPIDEEGVVNTKHNDGTADFDSRKKELFFTRCLIEDNAKMDCGIYMTELVGQNWKEPERQIIGTDTFANVGHPCLGPDDKYLYFVSSDYNSNGGRDIFLTTYNRREDRWENPTNLGSKVNTSEDERFPYVHGDGYLYFTSNGHPGMGGWDVFKVKLGEDGLPAGEVKNMEAPINSSYDDFHLVWEPGGDTEKGFVSSNREDGGLDDNIYAVYRTPLVYNLEGVVASSKTGEPISGAEVTMESADGQSYKVIADEDGYYIFDDTKIVDGQTYNLTFSAPKYLSATGDASTIGYELSSFEYVPSAKYYIKRLKLNKKLDPIEEPIVLPNVFFDFNKAFLREESKAALDSVVMILNNNPNITIELRSHTDYRGSVADNEDLSQRRADSSVAYLIEKGIDSARLTARGMGESEPFTIDENYDDYGADVLEKDVTLSERYIKTLSPEKQEVANQINRRTDIKVLSEDYVPAGGAAQDQSAGVDAEDIIEQKRNEEPEPGEIYIVEGRRESFGRIARKFNINMREFKTLNGGLRGVRPFPGLQLKVEPDGNYDEWDETHYQVQRRGMDWKDIAKKLDMDDDDLEDLNPEVDEDMLQPGFWVRIKK